MSPVLSTELVVKISADMAQLRSEMNAVQRDVGGSLGAIERTAGSAKAALMGLAGAVGLGALSKEFIETADAAALMAARLKLVVGAGDDFATAQRDIYDIAQKNNLGLQEATSLYTKLHDPVKRLGGGVKETSAIVESFALSLRVGGASAQEAGAATLQFAQAMGSGKLQGDEFRSIAEASPRFMKAMAEGMGVPIEQLKKMGSEGKLTADVVGNALVKSLEKLRAEGEQMPETVGGAITRFKNDLLVAVDEINKATGTNLGLVGMIDGARSLIGPLRDEMVGAFSAVGEWLGRSKADIGEIWDGIKALTGDVWGLVKSIGGAVGWLAEGVIKTGAIKVAIEAVRLIVAGLSDGIEITVAGFVKMGAWMLDFVGRFDDAAKLAAQAAHEAADATFKKFAEGKTAVGQLNAELEKNAKAMEEAKSKTAEGAKATDDHSKATKALATAAGTAASSLVTLKNKNVELTDEQKKGIEAQKKALDAIDDKLISMRQEIDLGEKESDVQRLVRKTQEDLRDGHIQFVAVKGRTIEQQKIDLAQKLELVLSTEQEVKKTKENAQAQKDLTEWRKKAGEAAIKQSEDMEAAVRRQREENEAIGKTSSQLAALEIARLKEEARLLSETVATENLSGACSEETEAHKKTLEALNQLIEAKEQGVHLKAAQEANEAWAATAKSIGDGLTDSLYRAFESGKGFWNTLWGGIKNTVKTTALKLLITGADGKSGIAGSLLSMIGLGGSSSSSSSSGGVGGGLGMLSGLGSVLGAGKALLSGGWINNFSGAASGVFANAGTSLFNVGFENVGSWIGENAIGLGNVAESLGSGLGYLSSIKNIADGKYGAGILGGVGTFFGGPIGGMLGNVIGGGLDKLFGGAGTHHGGAGYVSDGTTGRSITDGSAGLGWSYGDSVGKYFNADVQTALKDLTGGSANMLNALSKAFGGAGGYSVGAYFASDNNRESQGGRSILKDGQVLSEWGGRGLDKDSAKGLQQLTDALAGQVRDAMAQINVPDWARKQIDELGSGVTMEKLAETVAAITKMQAAMKALPEAFNQFGGVFSSIATASDAARNGLVQLAGGIENLMSLSKQFAADYYSADEQAGLQARQTMEAIKSLGLDGNTLSSREDFRALVESLGSKIEDATAQKQLVGLLELGPQFAQLSDYLKENNKTLEQAAASAPQVAVLEKMLTPAEHTAEAVTNMADQVATGNSILERIVAAVQSGTETVSAGLAAVASSTTQLAAEQARATAIAVANSGKLDDIASSGALNSARPSYAYDIGQPR